MAYLLVGAMSKNEHYFALSKFQTKQVSMYLVIKKLDLQTITSAFTSNNTLTLAYYMFHKFIVKQKH